nr:MICAL protein 2 [Hymenolepis microstoma]
MSVDTPTLRRRPPPRPPKSQYLLNKEAELRLSKQVVHRPPSTAYPKGINPFGESSDDEDSINNDLPLQHFSVPKNANPFDDLASDTDQEINPPEPVLVPEVQRNSQSEEVHDVRLVEGELDANKSIGNTVSPPAEAEIEKPEPSPPNPFDGFSDEEVAEKIKVDNAPTPQIHCKRPAPKPPVSGSTDGPSRDQSMRLSLHAVNEAAASPLPIQKSLSASSESVQRSKGPAPPLPVGEKREIRAEGFVKYPRLRREIEEVNGKLLQIDEEITTLNEKIEQTKDDEAKSKKYSKKMAKLVEKREDVSVKHNQLINRLQEQVLEDRHADLEFELRNILAKQEHLRTEEENKRSEELLNLLMEIVAERDKLVGDRNSQENIFSPCRQSSSTSELQSNDNNTGDDVARCG